MLSARVTSAVLCAQRCATQQISRNFGVTAVVSQKVTATDPIQQLFVKQVQEYGKKKKANQIEMSAENQKSFNRMVDAVRRKYGANEHGGNFPHVYRMFSTEIVDPFKGDGKKIQVPADSNGNSLIDETSGVPLFKNIADAKGSPVGFVMTNASGDILSDTVKAMESNSALYSGGKPVYKVLPYVKEDGTEVTGTPNAVVLPMTKSGVILKQIGVARS